MSDAVLTALIAALGSAVATMCGVVIVWLNLKNANAALALKIEKARVASMQRMDESRANQEEMKRDQKDMHVAVNSQMDKFKAVLAEAEFAKGDLAGRAALENEQRDKALAAMEGQKREINGRHEEPKKVEVVNPVVPVKVVSKDKK